MELAASHMLVSRKQPTAAFACLFNVTAQFWGSAKCRLEMGCWNHILLHCHMQASAKSEVSSQTGSPRTPAKPADTRKTIKTMAASLFRAFDEGKLRERGRALVQQQGESFSLD